MKLDEVQSAAQEQFAKQSHHYGRGHVLENIDDVRDAIESIPLPARAQVLDIATGAGHITAVRVSIVAETRGKK